MPHFEALPTKIGDSGGIKNKISPINALVTSIVPLFIPPVLDAIQYLRCIIVNDKLEDVNKTL